VSAPAILDTSIFVAIAQSRPLSRRLPDQRGVSVVTLAELELGVLMAKDGQSRATRLATLTRVRELTAGLPADERVASAYARLAAAELQTGVNLASTTPGSRQRPLYMEVRSGPRTKTSPISAR
jgi:predicted nucleic acid-binding protein